ncbi:sensor histidine kinase [Mucilaginibacter myungsuensis]|uniref:histidine kinase n=1 Tax=Mucilaginibacter myungsuensis TaxID=649104 RepID=A0A929PWT8_9SPHI|nr:histidine kinase [Mucilaginibacter myungsuensis]MBE9662479.1 hypothetical protein [Mucilaginibacter myungsuensis]MDN3597899.1 histidine kinase [Mucilaginibacter myungsuensis]
MQFDRIVTYFMPAHLRGNTSHPQYAEFRVVVSTCLIGLPLMLLFPIPLYLMNKPVLGYLVNNVLVIITLFCSKLLGNYRVPLSITALITYFIIYGWIKDTGLIYSSNVTLLHMYLLCAIWADKRYGGWAIISNLAVFGFIYYQTLHTGTNMQMHQSLGSASYAFAMNALITTFFGGFLAYLQFDQERDRLKIKKLQDQKIDQLDEAVKKRTDQLNTMRESIATDFHDETGNMLSAITRQASVLRSQLKDDLKARPLVESIIKNSDQLYASSKDFLWHLNHDSDDPQELFDYLTAYGQRFYNQFDVAFSATAEECGPVQFGPSAALNVIYIFKEAMVNVVKHSGAIEVFFEMRCHPGHISFSLQDNGQWKETNTDQPHYGLSNMERRCRKNDFVYRLTKQTSGTRIDISVPAYDKHEEKDQHH